jgi:DNA-binding transcriptional ArsR family regulator
VSAADPADSIDEGIQAMANRGRRTMLRLVRDGERTSSALAEAAGLSRSAASQHLRILREAGLVHVRVDGNRRLYSADVERLAALRTALDDFWGDRLASLKQSAEDEARRKGRRRSGVG